MDREKIAIDLLQLAAQLKPWQQDAMRRFASADTLSDEDEEELLRMIKKDADISTMPDPPKPIPIAKEHLTTSGTPKLSLTGVRNIKNVNCLDDRAHVEIQPEGLTAVFGLNATGKTGFTYEFYAQLVTDRMETLTGFVCSLTSMAMVGVYRERPISSAKRPMAKSAFPG